MAEKLNKNMTVGVVGLGYVGLPLALLTKARGFGVIGFDADSKKVNKINAGNSPISDQGLIDQLKNHPITATTDPKTLANADVILVCVPTPVINHTEPDLSILKQAVTDIAKHLRSGSLLIIESTINPGVCDEVILPLLAQVAPGLAGTDYGFAHCPERINPGDTTWDIKNINRVVGGINQASTDRAAAFYERLLDASIKKMDSLKEAEAVKIVENSFRDVNIAFVNELAKSFDTLGINLENVIDGAATKPFGYMPFRPGVGVGGHCIPVDPYYLIEYAKGFGFDHTFLRLARSINDSMPAFTVQKIQSALNSLGLPVKNTPITILGLSYKADVDDDRESPAYDVIRLLNALGANVKVYEPYIPERSDFTTLDEALQFGTTVVIATHHSQFKSISPQTAKRHKVQAVIDGRNLLKDHKSNFHQQGIVYHGIGVPGV